jgi:two-component system, OmpR family, sensor histidine kinase SaeS
MRIRPLVVSLVTVVLAAVPTAVLLQAMDHPRDEIAALVAVLVAIAVAWLALTHVATRLDVAGSLRRQYAAGVLGAVGLVLVSVLAGTALMVVSRRDAELVAVMLLFSLIVALRVASLLSGHAAAQITRLGEGLRRLAAGRGAEPLPETGPRELEELAIAANAMARDLTASDRARRELVAAVSHDLRTPIASLSLLVDAVADGVVTAPDEVAEYRHRMRVHLAHLRELVDDLFELARLDAGEDVAWLRVPVAVAELVEETTEAFRPAAEERRVTLTGTVGAGLPAVSASPERLQRVLFNLLENGVAHAPAGGAVTLSAARDDGEVRFEVADTGSGIAAADAARIFDRFYRGGADASRPAGGAGLGLAIARAIVEAHGGRIWVVNPGEPGARLAFTVPVHSPA